jgi:glutathione S-transferase
VSAWWVAHQLGKIERALALAVQRPPSLAPVSIGAIALGCSLGYLDWRKQYDWRSNCPALVDWFEQFRAAVPEFDATQHSF